MFWDRIVKMNRDIRDIALIHNAAIDSYEEIEAFYESFGNDVQLTQTEETIPEYSVDITQVEQQLIDEILKLNEELTEILTEDEQNRITESHLVESCKKLNEENEKIRDEIKSISGSQQSLVKSDCDESLSVNVPSPPKSQNTIMEWDVSLNFINFHGVLV